MLLLFIKGIIALGSVRSCLSCVFYVRSSYIDTFLTQLRSQHIHLSRHGVHIDLCVVNTSSNIGVVNNFICINVDCKNTQCDHHTVIHVQYV